MYVKDSIIEKQIEKDKKIQFLKGRIKEIEDQMGTGKGDPQSSKLQEKLEKLRGELTILLE